MDDHLSRGFLGAHFPSSPPPDLQRSGFPRSSEPPTSPPLFSSDDPPEEADISNYETPRVKRKVPRPWWTSDDQVTPVRRKRAKLSRSRNFDSGVWMPSDDSMDISDSGDAPATVPQETIHEKIKRVTEHMSTGEAILYRRLQQGIDENETAYLLNDLHLEDSELQHIDLINQVIQPPPDPGAEVPAEGQYRSMVPEIFINLRQNKLLRLHPSLFALQHLTTLNLRSNKIYELPPQIRQLHNLKDLDLTFNKLTLLPAELIPLLAPNGNLQRLELWGNPLIREEREEDLLEMVMRHNSGNQNPWGNTSDPEHSLLHHVRSEALPKAIEDGEDRAMILPLIDAIKRMENEHANSHRPAHHPNKHAQLSIDPALPELCASFLGTTAISFYDQIGHHLQESPELPKSEEDEFDYIVRTSDSTYNAPDNWFIPANRSQLHALSTIAFNKLLEVATPSDIEEELNDFSGSIPAQAQLLLQCARKNEGEQFEVLKTCFCCGKKYTVVAAEWIEFWSSNHDQVGRNDVLPFKVQVCSWGCVPEEIAAEP